MKPVFQEEQDLLERKLNITLPKNIWRKGSKIYLNHFDKRPFLSFKVNLLSNSLMLKEYKKPTHKNYTLEEEYLLKKDMLESKVIKSINMTKKFILENLSHKFIISLSGGKDSTVMKTIMDLAIEELYQEGIHVKYRLISFNTSNDTAETYLYLKNYHYMQKENIISPKIGFYNWITKNKNYFTPSIFVRNCCSTYKEGQLSKVLNKNEKAVIFLGMRKYESIKRKHYDFDLNESQIRVGNKLIVPNTWKRFLPIVEWDDSDVWLYTLNRKIEYNKMYNLGFNRVGCLICPNQHDYTELLIKEYYPKQWSRWTNILSKGYEIYGIDRRLKWSLLEWCEGGKWKKSVSKEFELTTKKATPERIEELSKLKNIPKEIAIRYFNKKCNCGKKLNPTEIAMFLKITGIYENINNDTRNYLCKKCLCELLNISSKEYKDISIEYSKKGCNLF
ncbi:phosphoadenosine phosphosulfate reductase domain-containing protein [Clostridioides difficile]|uniref:phosphoadenosine phosphosulfate reductase domain-containing protein n=1 Tax=Clostridioides difficile TaxID=1496 RepID=UPI000D1E0564|nr:phosphoadenosine phosphosulfate reductase family protein [Clostridioides difficile]HBE9444587.1 phosphoadenosine phosphosulfate reductase family protein [Clostridioides difficile]